MKKEIRVMVKIKNGFVSTNSLYSARITYAGGRPKAMMYKNPKAVEVERIVRDQLRAIDFEEYRDFLTNTKSFNLLIQFIVKSNIGKKDTSNYIKNLEDIWTRFVREDLGITTYDDRLHVEVHAYKSIIPKAEEEIACISLTESKFNTRFDIVEEPKKIFLGGTTVNTTWRDEIIPELKKRKIKYFNPIVPDWTPECQDKEEEEKETSNTHLYVLTPEMQGVYSVAECIDSAYQHQSNGFCFVCVMGTKDEWGEARWRSLDATVRMINERVSKGDNVRAAWVTNINDVLQIIDNARPN